MNRFLFCSMEYLGLLLVLQDSWRSYAYWDEIELWEVEMAACVVGRVRDCVFLHFWWKTCCSYRNWTLDVTMSFMSGIWGRVGVISMHVKSRITLRSTEPILGWHKVVPVRGMLNASNLYSTVIPRKESIN